MSFSLSRPGLFTCNRQLLLLAFGALGVVYGDIGTSPLYALRECFGEHYDVDPTRANVLGALSLIFWSMTLVITVKYLLLVLRADNKGEGGVLALTSLAMPVVKRPIVWRTLVLMGLFGTAMLYGDGVITPAISVLSAVEGLSIATDVFQPYILPIACVILVGLFLIQSRGTGRVGVIFGPVMVVWFLTLAVLGLVHLASRPQVLLAINPMYCVWFFLENGQAGFWMLGSVFLVVTGGEALYADMGHFGSKPIRLAWFAVVYPGLLLNYMGQGALILRHPQMVDNPFYRMAPQWMIYPLVALSAMAAMIASQALISGVYSLTMQAVQLGFCPRMTIRHTSSTQIGQIYMPWVNWLMMIACLALVLGFQSSSHLAAAYGIAVTTTMGITTVLFAVVAWRRWRWHPAAVLLLAGFFLVIDLGFFLANAVKIPKGGWFPIVMALAVFLLMTTWKKGRGIIGRKMMRTSTPFTVFLDQVRRDSPLRVAGTAVFMSSSRDGTPPALLHNLKHNKVLHEQTLLLNVQSSEEAHVPVDQRVKIEPLGQGFFRMVIHHGFMDEPDIPDSLSRLPREVIQLEASQVTYFLGRENLIPGGCDGMSRWRSVLFAWMSRNAQNATTYFHLPPNRVVELGTQIEL